MYLRPASIEFPSRAVERARVRESDRGNVGAREMAKMSLSGIACGSAETRTYRRTRELRRGVSRAESECLGRMYAYILVARGVRVYIERKGGM